MTCDYEILKTLIEKLIPKEAFWQSQLFGVIVGGVIAGIIGFISTFFVNYFQNKRDDRIHLCEKREELYIKLYDFLMKYNAQSQKDSIPRDLVIFSNEIQPEMIFASEKISKFYYDLCTRIRTKPDEKDAIKECIIDFQKLIRTELGIKD